MTEDVSSGVRVEIYACRTGRPLGHIRVAVDAGADRTAAIIESVTRWCERHGYDFGDEVTWTTVY